MWEKCVLAKSHEIICIFWKYFLCHLSFHYDLHLSSIVVFKLEIGSFMLFKVIRNHNVVSGLGIQFSLFRLWRNIVDKEHHTCWIGRIFSERHNSALSHHTLFIIASQLPISSQIVEINLRWTRNYHNFKLFVDVNCLVIHVSFWSKLSIWSLFLFLGTNWKKPYQTLCIYRLKPPSREHVKHLQVLFVGNNNVHIQYFAHLEQFYVIKNSPINNSRPHILIVVFFKGV